MHNEKEFALVLERATLEANYLNRIRNTDIVVERRHNQALDEHSIVVIHDGGEYQADPKDKGKGYFSNTVITGDFACITPELHHISHIISDAFRIFGQTDE